MAVFFLRQRASRKRYAATGNWRARRAGNSFWSSSVRRICNFSRRLWHGHRLLTLSASASASERLMPLPLMPEM